MYKCGNLYRNYIHMNLGMRIYICMCNIRMYVFNVYMVMYVLIYTCVYMYMGACVCAGSR